MPLAELRSARRRGERALPSRGRDRSSVESDMRGLIGARTRQMGIGDHTRSVSSTLPARFDARSAALRETDGVRRPAERARRRDLPGPHPSNIHCSRVGPPGFEPGTMRL